jgi:hypothetical protein
MSDELFFYRDREPAIERGRTALTAPRAALLARPF